MCFLGQMLRAYRVPLSGSMIEHNWAGDNNSIFFHQMLMLFESTLITCMVGKKALEFILETSSDELILMLEK